MLHIQKFLILEGPDGWDILKNKYKIFMKHHPIHKNLVLLNYDKFKSPICPITNECRGIILDTKTFACISKSFPRFGNIQKNPKGFSWGSLSSVTEQIDGTLINLYFWNNKWQVATLDSWGCENIPETNETYEKVFFSCIQSQSFLSHISKSCSIIFEMVSPLIPKVNKVFNNKIYLMGIYNNSGGFNTQYLSRSTIEDYAHYLQVDIPRSISKYSPTEILNYINEKPIHFTGIVACDRQGNLVSIKKQSYKEIEKLLDNPQTSSIKNILRYVLDAKDMPQPGSPLDFVLKPKIEHYKRKIKHLLEDLTTKYNEYKGLGRRVYAERVSTLPNFQKWILFKALNIRRRPSGTTLKPILYKYLLRVMAKAKNRKYI